MGAIGGRLLARAARRLPRPRYASARMRFARCLATATLAAASIACAQRPAVEAGSFAEGQAAVVRARALLPPGTRARNVILFVGDGMGLSTITAARILEGQRRGESGEENRLAF